MPHGIKSSRDQLPLLKIAKEYPQRGDAARASAWGEYLASASNMDWIDASPVSTMPLTDNRDEFGRKTASPIGWRWNRWMRVAEPTAHVEQEVIALGSGTPRICGSIEPETAQARPLSGSSLRFGQSRTFAMW
jgi:hypothetical protein